MVMLEVPCCRHILRDGEESVACTFSLARLLPPRCGCCDELYLILGHSSVEVHGTKLPTPVVLFLSCGFALTSLLLCVDNKGHQFTLATSRSFFCFVEEHAGFAAALQYFFLRRATPVEPQPKSVAVASVFSFLSCARRAEHLITRMLCLRLTVVGNPVT